MFTGLLCRKYNFWTLHKLIMKQQINVIWKLLFQNQVQSKPKYFLDSFVACFFDPFWLLTCDLHLEMNYSAHAQWPTWLVHTQKSISFPSYEEYKFIQVLSWHFIISLQGTKTTSHSVRQVCIHGGIRRGLGRLDTFSHKIKIKRKATSTSITLISS